MKTAVLGAYSPVQPGGGGLIPPPGACNLLFLHPYSTAWGLIRQEPNKYISFKSLRLFPLTFVGWLGVYFLPFYRHKTFSQLAIHKQKKFSNPLLCLSFFLLLHTILNCTECNTFVSTKHPLYFLQLQSYPDKTMSSGTENFSNF